MLLVEFDPETQWYAVNTTIAAEWLQNHLRILYNTSTRPREEVVKALEKLGIEVQFAEESGMLRVDDMYSVTMGLEKEILIAQPIDDRYVKWGSLKIADLSLDDLRGLREGGTRLSKWGQSDQSNVLAIWDSLSPLLRFNDERAVLEFMETRELPLNRKLGRVAIGGVLRRLHSESFYTRLENAFDGIIELRVMERDDEIKNLLRIKSLKGQPHDARWHEVRIDSRGEASIVT
jgi:archaellum biogenesis ATPase FlaH